MIYKNFRKQPNGNPRIEKKSKIKNSLDEISIILGTAEERIMD